MKCPQNLSFLLGAVGAWFINFYLPAFFSFLRLSNIAENASHMANLEGRGPLRPSTMGFPLRPLNSRVLGPLCVMSYTT